MIFDYLHATARFYIDTLSHCDGNCYWYREDNQDRGNNDKGDSFETYHHLLCNMTGVPTGVVYTKIVETGETAFLSHLYFKIVQQDLLGKQKTLVEVQSFGNVPFRSCDSDSAHQVECISTPGFGLERSALTDVWA